jgi:hypothetical protein
VKAFQQLEASSEQKLLLAQGFAMTNNTGLSLQHNGVAGGAVLMHKTTDVVAA